MHSSETGCSAGSSSQAMTAMISEAEIASAQFPLRSYMLKFRKSFKQMRLQSVASLKSQKPASISAHIHLHRHENAGFS